MLNPRRANSRRGLAARRLVIIAGCAVAVVATGAGLIAAAHGQAEPKAGQAGGGGAPRTSDVIEVTRGDFEITTTATGELRARNQIDIRNTLESETTIVEIVAEGKTVKAGDVLIKLNAESIQTRTDEESLQLESARAAVVESEETYQIQVSENESSVRAARLKLDLANLDLEKWKSGEVESKRQQNRHEVERTEKDEARLADKVTKSRALKEKGYYSQDQLTQDELAWSQAQAALAKARLDQRVYDDFEYPKDKRTKESAVEEAQAELDRVGRQNASRLASKEADRTNRRSALTIREQKFQKYQEQLKAATILAPNDGLVVYSTSLDSGMRFGGDEGPLQVGSKVYPNQNLIILPDTSEMIAAVKVHESLAGRIRPGQTATIKVDAVGGERYTGRVESIGILAEQTSRWMDPNLREYTVRIALDLPRSGDSASESVGRPGLPGEKGMAARHGLKPSMRCEADIQLGTVKDAVTVPIQSIFSDGLVRYVHVQPPGEDRFVRRPVLVGQRSDRFAEVRAGLEPGERILIRKPEPSEVLGGPWDVKQLAAAGLSMNEQGQVVPMGGGPGGRGGRPGGNGRPGAGAGGPKGGAAGGPEATKGESPPKSAAAAQGS